MKFYSKIFVLTMLGMVLLSNNAFSDSDELIPNSDEIIPEINYNEDLINTIYFSNKYYDTIKTLTIIVAKNIPGIGDVVNQIETVVDLVKAVNSDMTNTMDSTKKISINTIYACSKYEAIIDVYDYNRTWKNHSYFRDVHSFSTIKGKL